MDCSVISSDVQKIRNGGSIALLIVALASVPAFTYWVHRQADKGRPALIPNKIWKNLPFSSICVTVMLSFGVLYSMEQYCSL
jgi:hypothetical protein